jgi:hypothetical protein
VTPECRENGLISAWPPHVQTIVFVSSADGTRQPAAFYDSGTPGAKPLLVALHTWSYDFCQEMSIPYAEWCIEHDWILLAPDFLSPIFIRGRGCLSISTL